MDKVTSFCKVWGYLKYYHPMVAKGTTDWDSVFFTGLEELEHIYTNAGLNNYYARFITSLGNIHNQQVQTMSYDTSCNFGKPLNWIYTTASFTDSTRSLLMDVAIHRNTGPNYYVKTQKRNGSALFTNEKSGIKASNERTENKILLLALARYWNMIEYFSPYKHLTDQPWDSVLAEMALKAQNVQTPTQRWFWYCELLSKINDSHTSIPLPFQNMLPVYTKIIDNKAIVTSIINDSLAEKNDIRRGDVILAINDTTIAALIEHYGKYIGASNAAAFLRTFSFFGLRKNVTEATITYDREGVIGAKKVNLYSASDLAKVMDNEETEQAWTYVADKIGYIETSIITNGKLRKALHAFKRTKGIIIDVRTYPEWIVYPLCKQLSNARRPFVVFTSPDLSFPGTFVLQKPLLCGSRNGNGYKGKIVILINEKTQSRAEFTVMALQSIPGVVCIGSQTSGADGNVTRTPLPNGWAPYMTGLGTYYPDGKQTQRIGIVPDIEVHPTIKGIREGKDEVLEYAISYIQNL